MTTRQHGQDNYRPTTHWSKLKPVPGFDRVPDCNYGHHSRMLRCDDCGRILPALGIAYHRGKGQKNTSHECWNRPGCNCYRALRHLDVTVVVWDGQCKGHEKASDLRAGPGPRDRQGYRILGPVYGPPEPTPAMLAEAARMAAYRAHQTLSTEECDIATTAAGCIFHPAPVAPPLLFLQSAPKPARREFHWGIG